MGFFKHKRPVDLRTASDPDVLFDTQRQNVTVSTAASTALGPRGAFAFESTSTGAPVVYDIPSPKKGDRLSLMVNLTASSSVAPYHFNLGDFLAPATSADMIVLSTNGAGISLIAISTAAWLTDGNQGATFSTST